MALTQVWLQAPAYLWPLSSQSYPTWTAILVVLATCFARSFILKHGSADHRDKRKRDNLLRVADAILAYVAEKDAKKAPKSPTSPTSEDEDGEDFGPEGMPEASRVFALLWDEVYGIPTTEYGIPAADERVAELQCLLRRLAATELRKAVHMTKQASRIAHGHGKVPGNQEDIMTYWSGEKLREVIDFQKKSLEKHLGAGYVEKEALADAELYLKQLQKDQGKHMHQLLGLISPQVPALAVCFGLMLMREIVASVFHQIGYWVTPVEMAVEGNWAGMRERLLQIFVGHVIHDALATVGSAYEDRASARLHQGVTQGVLRSLLQQDYEYFDRTSASVLQERLNSDADQLGRNLIEFPREVICMTTHVVVSLIIVYTSIPTDLFLMAIAPLVPIMALQYYIIKFWQRMDERMRKLNESSAATTGETLREIKTVRQFAMEGSEAHKFASTTSCSELMKEAVSTSHRVVGLLFGLSIYGGLVFTVYLGAYRVHSGEMTVAALMDMTFKLNFNVVHTLRRLIEQLPRFNRLMQPLARISELLESTPKIETPLDQASRGLTPERFTGLIEFDDVHFAYPKDPRKSVLNGLTFTVEPGQKVALIGHTGCGKSSTMSLLQRLYDPQQGEVRIDGKPLKDYDLRHLRKRIVIVDQFTVLFACSVRDNITYGMDGATDEEIELACREAAAWDFLQEKPDKLMTQVATGGSNFSGGQRQRIAIARAIVRKPDVILLDEATASLDTENEKLVQKALDKLARKGSALVIAHRLSTIKDSDKIVVIDHGVKVEEGTHHELVLQDEQDKTSAELAPPLSADALTWNRCCSDTQTPDLSSLAELAPVDAATMAPPPPPAKLQLNKALTFHGPQVRRAEKGHVTYKKLWEASTAEPENLTVNQMQEKIDKMEAELALLKGKVSKIRAHTLTLRDPLPGSTRSAPPPLTLLRRMTSLSERESCEEVLETPSAARISTAAAAA